MCCPTVLVTSSPQLQKREAGAVEEMQQWFKDPLVQALVFGMWCSGVGNSFLYSFVPTLFVEVYGVKVAELGAWNVVLGCWQQFPVQFHSHAICGGLRGESGRAWCLECGARVLATVSCTVSFPR